MPTLKLRKLHLMSMFSSTDFLDELFSFLICQKSVHFVQNILLGFLNKS